MRRCELYTDGDDRSNMYSGGPLTATEQRIENLYNPICTRTPELAYRNTQQTHTHTCLYTCMPVHASNAYAYIDTQSRSRMPKPKAETSAW